MKHKRGIELSQADIATQETLGGLAQWYELIAHCPACEHAGAIDRYALARRFGKSMCLAGLGERLRCAKCSNKKGNCVMLEVRPRD